MTDDHTESENRVELRRRAEAKLERETLATPDISPEEVRGLIHELRTHQIELELQNEELRRGQAELIESRDRYSDLYDFAPVGYVTLSRKGLILEANLTLADMFGAPKGTLSSQLLSAFIVPDDQDVFYRHCRRILAIKERCTCQLRMFSRDTDPFWAEIDSVPIEGNREGDIRLRTVVMDITERKRAEEETSKFQAAADNANYGIAMSYVDGSVTYLNEYFAAVHGYSRDEVVGRNLSLFHTEEQLERVRQLNTQLLQDGSYACEEVWHKHRNGSVFPMLMNGIAIIGDAGRSAFLATTAIDISERKQTQRELAAARETAEAANRAKSEFLANMSHEIRTPMTAITGFTELLLSKERPPKERREYLTIIQRNAESLLGILGDILDLSKIEAEKLQLERVDWSPRHIVEEVQALMGEQANDKDLSLEVKYVEPLPLLIHTDPGRLRQILLNLVGNAIKFTDSGRVRITVHSLPEQGRRSQIQFEVADTGVGISAAAIKDLFEPFTQVDMSSTRHFGGTGLGLSISQRLAKMLGGQIEVESEPGKGSTFTLTVDTGQAVKAELPTPPRETSEWTVAGTCESLQGRVLLADDIPDMTKLMRRTLENTRLELELAENGRMAYEMAMASKAAGKPYDLILMDIRMPVMDGHEATRRLRKDGWERPIVALTAHSMRGDCEKCREAGCDAYLSKPVSRAQLFETLEKYLSRTGGTTGEGPSEMQVRDGLAEGILFDGLLDDATTDQLVQEYAETLPAKAEALEKAFRTQDLELLAGLTHELKGLASMYGFSPVSEKARALRQLAAQGKGIQHLEGTVMELIQLCREAANRCHKEPAQRREQPLDESQ